MGVESDEHERCGVVRHQRSPPQAGFVDASVEGVGVIPHELDELAVLAPVWFVESDDEGVPRQSSTGR